MHFGSYANSYIVSAIMLLSGAGVALTVRPPKTQALPSESTAVQPELLTK
jgi:hypothetical protein